MGVRRPLGAENRTARITEVVVDSAEETPTVVLGTTLLAPAGTPVRVGETVGLAWQTPVRDGVKPMAAVTAGGQVFVGLPIRGSDTGDYLVRNLLGIDPQSKLIAIGELVQPGQSVTFCKRDVDAATEDMNRMLESIKKGLFGKPRGGVYYWLAGEIIEASELPTSDVEAIRNNKVAISPVHFNLTNYAVLDNLRERFDDLDIV